MRSSTATRERPDRARGRARRRRRLRRRLRRAPARAARRHDRQPRELHALHADPARGGVRDARAAPRRRPAPPDVPARRAPARPGGRRSTTRRAAASRSRPTTGRSRSATTTSSSRSAPSPRTLPIPGSPSTRSGSRTSPTRSTSATTCCASSRPPRRRRPTGHRRRDLTFVFVGAGYAGVEALAELSDLVRDALRHYPTLRDAPQRWVLVDAAPKILPEIPTRLGEYAAGSSPSAASRSGSRRRSSGRSRMP